MGAKHLMRFQSENAVLKFFWRCVVGVQFMGLNMQMLQSKMFPRTYSLKNSCSKVKINFWQKENKAEKIEGGRMSPYLVYAH